MVFPRLGKEISRGGLIVAREVQQLQREARNVLDARSPGQTPMAQRQTCAAAKSSMAQKAEPRGPEGTRKGARNKTNSAKCL